MEKTNEQEETLLTNLPPEVIHLVSSKLLLEDHFNFSISLCCSHLQDALIVVRNEFQKRAMSLSTIWRCIYFEDVRYLMVMGEDTYALGDYFCSPVVQRQVKNLLGRFRTSKSEEYVQERLGQAERTFRRDLPQIGFPPPPLVLANRLQTLYLGYLDVSVCKTIAAELPNLWCLEISQDGPRLDFDKLLTLPHSLGYCTQLKVLDIRIPSLSEFPRCVLQLYNLESLSVINAKISALPDDIGIRLKNLEALDITGNPICAIPHSLLQRMENHFRELKNDQVNMLIHSIPILFHGTNITNAYLKIVLTENCFPHLFDAYFPTHLLPLI